MKSQKRRLTSTDIEKFVHEGFVRIDDAFPVETANECRAILWKATGCDPHNPASWTQPVIRIGELVLEPFVKAANTAILHNAYDQLVGKDNWHPKTTLGSFAIRFPSMKPSPDTGWHVDASFPGEDINNYLEWRINFYSRGRGLLMLFLFSDVSDKDAPTIIRQGSHLDVAKILKPEGESGLSFMKLAKRLDDLPKRQEVLATGEAGTVYLCHPFMVHAAQHHRGVTPKFMAQPPLFTKHDFNIKKPEKELCPVERAIWMGLQ